MNEVQPFTNFRVFSDYMLLENKSYVLKLGYNLHIPPRAVPGKLCGLQHSACDPAACIYDYPYCRLWDSKNL